MVVNAQVVTALSCVVKTCFDYLLFIYEQTYFFLKQIANYSKHLQKKKIKEK